ncbi:hypothetical protein BVU17_01695 [Haloarcula taiwanensis]|uniref:Metal-dependent hydrolase n=1 Tax=Haloarcula taiwanensis TaxID=1932004 RepID=A0A2H4ZUY3_9EURY|nr:MULTISPECIES: hypothetical protein [Haloarcula]AUG46294.1 hypothetical protein BVU17_01695 [Haloarcula taiwanensis]RLM36513.1 hypothetical protein DVK01_07765 [Haloarcula sp. Atlit-120R]RLM45104.1 hypothetical protein DVK00_11715 [Haloarcula sp. Atlit-47R]RLM83415.1 hypothetical protein D3D01_23185 [Haloarcula sp. Atlit-7R]
MYSRDHAIVSAAVGAAGVVVLPLSLPWWAAVGYAVVVGVAIDVDHFAVARLESGDWAALRRCLRNPKIVLLDQDKIFGPQDLWPLQRLLSHHLIGGLAVGSLWLVSEPLSLFTALVLYAHVLGDLVWDNYLLETYREQHAMAATSVSESDSE